MKIIEKNNLLEKYDVLVVGAGLSGAVLAERLASQSNKKVLVIDKKTHIGGGCYDCYDENNILINKYGAHLFHTNDEVVWGYIQEFCKWQRWDHKVLGSLEGKMINIPVNINTVNCLFENNIQNEREMNEWLKTVQIKYKKISNSAEIAKSRVGEELYKKIFKDYTFKQWNKYPEELDPSVLARIPIRNNFDERYFSDKYQALPSGGYTKFIENILSHSNISVYLNTDFFTAKELVFDSLIFTGRIDNYFKKDNLGELEYRSIKFVEERYKNMNFYQQNSVVNYPEGSVPFTRIVEYKHFLNQKSPHTTIVKEFAQNSGEPYYPVPNRKNLTLYEKYKKLAENEKNTYFVGRLANYKYFNMDQAIKNALDFYSDLNEGIDE